MKRCRRNCALVLALASGAAAQPALGAGAPVTISHGWFRALPAERPAGGYFTLHNPGANPIALTGASSPACGMLMLHRSEETGGVARMMDVDRVAVPAGGSVSFSPGGYHLMCMQPSAAMHPGGTVEVTLRFLDGTTADAAFVVRNASGQ